jgi:hypothetical protein
MADPLILDLASIFIMHSAFETVLNDVAGLIEDHDDSLEACNLCITGPAGVGKTQLIKELEKRFPRVKDAVRVVPMSGVEHVSDEIPLLTLDMPPQPTASKLARRMLRLLGDPFYHLGKNDFLTDRVQILARACKVKVVIIDEAQRAVDRDGTVRGEELADWLKEQYNQLNISFFLVGMGRVRHLLDFDDQIDRRWDNEIVIPPYEWGDDGHEDIDSRVQFVTLLATYAEVSPLPFCDKIDVCEEDTARRFYYASRGVLGHLRKLLLAAARIAREQGDTKLTIESLRRGYDRAFRKEKLHESLINPWGADWDGRLPPPLRDHTVLLHPKNRKKRRPRKSERKAALAAALAKR